jgi:hypothetical protein
MALFNGKSGTMASHSAKRAACFYLLPIPRSPPPGRSWRENFPAETRQNARHRAAGRAGSASGPLYALKQAGRLER